MLTRSIIFAIMILAPVICLSQECLTWGEIYDYEVDDVFHYTEHGEWVTWPWGYYDKLSHIRVIGKTLSTDLDTIHYVMSVKQNYRNSQYPDWEYSATIEQYHYQHLDHSISCDTTYINNLYNGRPISYRLYYSYGVIAQIQEEYARACGQVTYYSEDIDPERKFIMSRSLVYFKKGEEEWGEPVVLMGIEDAKPQHYNFKLFPNPASDIIAITIDNPVDIFQVQIFNISGKLVISARDEFEKVDISRLPPGLYIVKITADAWTTARKLIVQ